MNENIGKRAQQEREKRLREQDEAIRKKINTLSFYSEKTEENFSVIKELIRANKRNKKDGLQRISIGEFKNRILQNISQLEDGMVELSALDTSKAATISPHYKQKIIEWQEQLKKLEPQIQNAIINGTDDVNEFEPKSFWDKFMGSSNDDSNNNPGEQAQKEAQIINSIIFSNNVDELIQTLLNFGNIIDTEISSFDLMGTEHKFSAARAKFANGLSLLKALDPTNNIIPHFENQLQKWIKKWKLYIIIRLCLAGAAALFFLIIMLLSKSS